MNAILLSAALLLPGVGDQCGIAVQQDNAQPQSQRSNLVSGLREKLLGVAEDAVVTNGLGKILGRRQPATSGANGKDGKDGANGKDGAGIDPAVVKQMIADAVAQAMKQAPPSTPATEKLPLPGANGKAGRDGADGKPGQDGKDGQSIDPVVLQGMIDKSVDGALAKLPTTAPMDLKPIMQQLTLMQQQINEVKTLASKQPAPAPTAPQMAAAAQYRVRPEILK